MKDEYRNYRQDGFKKLMHHDTVHTLLNLDEFGEWHKVDGRDIACVINNDYVEKRRGIPDQEDPLSNPMVMLYCYCHDLRRPPTGGQSLNVDGKMYIVQDWTQQANGKLVISLIASNMR